MRRMLKFAANAAALLATGIYVGGAGAQTVVYDSIPKPTPPNVVSLGFQCCGTSEFGDEITLAPGPRGGGFVTVLMSSWSKQSDYPTMSAAGYTHPITLSIYDTEATARSRSPLFSVTRSFLVPWRPEADPTCAGGTAWRSPVDGLCYNGFAFTIEFDLRQAGPGGTPVQLPNTLIFGVAYNTNTWGYNPLNMPGPYESLNVGLNAMSGPSVGTDLNPDGVYWNTVHSSWYSDGGASGAGIFRPDTAWAPYVPAAKISTFQFVTAAEDCKKGGWMQVARLDGSGFKNQGDCVSYVQNGK